MAKTWKQHRLTAIIIACILFLLGLTMLIYPEISALTVCYCVGILLIAVGVTELLRYFSLGYAGVFFRFDLSLGLVSILIGLLLTVHPEGAVAFLPVAIGIYMISKSVFSIQLSVEMRRIRSPYWYLPLLTGISGAVLAVLMLTDPFTGAAALTMFAGVCLILCSVQSLLFLICISREWKRLDGEWNGGKIIDADWSKVD